jgi:hypothetical protein
MKAWPKLLAFVALATGTSASADIPVSPLGDVYLTFNDCLDVAQPSGISTDKLASLGWSKATSHNADGTPGKGPLIYGNPKRKPIIILSSESGDGVCIVMARIETAETFPKFLEAWGPRLPKANKDGVIGFYDDGHPVLIRETGTREKPALTMTVGVPSEKK